MAANQRVTSERGWRRLATLPGDVVLWLISAGVIAALAVAATCLWFSALLIRWQR